MRLFNWKRSVETEQSFGIDFIFNVIFLFFLIFFYFHLKHKY